MNKNMFKSLNDFINLDSLTSATGRNDRFARDDALLATKCHAFL